MYKNRIYLVFIFVGIYIILFLLRAIDSINEMIYGQVITLFAIYFSIVPIFNALKHKNITFIIWFFFMFTYTYTLKYYYFNQVFISYHQMPSSSSLQSMNKLSELILFFNLTLWITLNKKSYQIRTSRPSFIKNNYLFYFNLTIFIMMAILGNTSDSIFVAGGYAQSIETGSRNTLTEYSIIFFVAAFFTSGYSKKKIKALYLLSFLFIIKNLLQGGRIETVMILFVILTLDLIYRYSFKFILIGALIAFIFLHMYSFFRHNPENLLYLTDFNSIMKNMFITGDAEIISTNQGDVVFASERMILLLKDGVLTIEERLIGLGSFIASIVFPLDRLPDAANLTRYRLDLYTSGGGCLSSIYFYVYFSYLGIITLSLLISKAINIFNRIDKLSPLFFYSFFLIITLPRWFAYNPIFLIKYCIIGAFYLYFNIKYNSVSLNKNYKHECLTSN